jgi:rhodanese-related sulfurtransferase
MVIHNSAQQEPFDENSPRSGCRRQGTDSGNFGRGRRRGEYQNGHLSGAINIPRGLLEFRFSNDESLNSRDLNIVIYCKNSGRAALSAKSLGEMGYLHVKSITGGIEAWQEAGKPVLTPSLPEFD